MMESDTPRQGGVSAITYGSEEYKPYEDNTDNLQDYIITRLNEAGISIDRAVPMKYGTKRPKGGYTGWQNRELRPIDEILGHWGIRTGNGLVVFDIDDWNETPDEICRFIEENPTLTIESPHTQQKATGKECHYFYSTDSNLNKDPDGCDIQGDGSLVATGSEIHGIRGGGDCSYDDCCSEESPGRYSVKEDRAITHVPGDVIDALVPDNESTDNSSRDIPETYDTENVTVDRELVDTGIEHIRAFNNEYPNGFDTVMDLIRGGRGEYGSEILRDDGKIDRSKADAWTFSLLFGVMKLNGESDKRATEIAYHLYTNFCQNEGTRFMKDSGDERKWNRDGNYRENRMKDALDTFSPDRFVKWANKTDPKNIRRRNHEPSRVVETAILVTVDLLYGQIEGDTSADIRETILWDYGYVVDEETVAVLTQPNRLNKYVPHQWGDMESENPQTTAECIGEIARQLNGGVYKKGYWIETVRDLQRFGRLKLAYIPENENGQRWVYYPVECDDPDSAEFVRCNGFEFEPGDDIPEGKKTEI